MNTDYKDMVETILDYLDKLAPAITTLCNEVRVGNLQNINVITNIMEGCSWIVKSAAIMNVEFKLNLKEIIVNIGTRSKKVVSVMENRDYVSLCDIFTYGMIPDLEKIFDSIAALEIHA